MGTDREEDGGDVVIALAPNVQGTTSPIADDEPPYGWVVCMSLHLINAFTWGVIAV